MKIELIRLALGEKFKYNEYSPEFELVSFVPSQSSNVSEFCNARNLETGLVTQHYTNNEVHISPYEFCLQLNLF